MSRIAKDLSRSAPWHIHPQRPSILSTDDVINNTAKSGRHSSSNFTALPSTQTNGSGRGSPASYSTLASASPTSSSSQQPQQPPASTLCLDPSTTTMPPSTATATTTRPTPSIAIIGAGIASLRAASLLLRTLPLFTHLTIYEARPRLGGRLHQATVGAGHRVDMGPNWIHGTTGNPIVTLAERTGTLMVEPEEDGDSFDCEGRRMGREEARGVAADVWEGVSAGFVFSDAEGEGVGSWESLFGWFEERFGGRRERGKGRWRGLSDGEGWRRLRDVLGETRMWGPFIGENVERQSLKFFWMEECVDGGNVFVADTYEKIVEEVARPVVESGCVRFEKAVERVEVLAGDQGIKLTVRDVAEGLHGQVSEEVFDEVICTAPLGWLKQHKKEAFVPPLPTRVDQAIDNISYGRLEKLYVSFPRAFWLDDSSLSSSNGPEHKDKDDDDPSRPLALFTHFHHPSHPSYHPLVPKDQSPPSWNQNLVSLAHLPGPAAHPTLLFYIYGDCATYLVNSVSGLSEGSAEYEKVLWEFAKPWVAKLPGYRDGEKECQPVEGGLLCTRWQDDGWAGNGSYACFLTGLEDGEGDVSAMREGLGLAKEADGQEEGKEVESLRGEPRRGGLWLAGEHTAPVVALGTTTGAWWSGEGVARRICRKWGYEVAEDDGDVGVNQEEATQKLREETRSGGGPGGIVAGKDGSHGAAG